MRNGIYTIYNDLHLPVNTLRDNEDEVLIRFEGLDCPFLNFVKSEHELNVYFLKQKLKEVSALYYVKTFGVYKDYIFEVFDAHDKDLKKVFIGTREEKAFINLNLRGDKTWAFTEVFKNELTDLWEERSQTHNFPLPSDILEFQVLL